MDTIRFNNEISPGYHHMGIRTPELAAQAKPGQFVMISVREGRLDPLLRRPMGIMLIEEDGIEILYRIVGRGTRIMAGMKEGEAIDVLGPLGNGFDIPFDREVWVVAGGCGAAPFFEVAKQLSKKKMGKGLRVFLGGGSSSDVLCVDVFRRFGVTPDVATEDGSSGCKGLVTSPLEEAARLNASSKPLLLASGPHGMLKAVAALAEKYKLECLVSLDNRMACGFGVCLGCVVPVKNLVEENLSRETPAQYKCVCSDGPVFPAEEIAW